MNMRYSIVKDSRQGARRENQDRVGYWRAPGALLIAVADGLGGHKGGELAAEVAMNCIGDAFMAEAQPCLADPDMFLLSMPGKVHSEIVREGHKAGMGDSPRTTLVMCVVQGGDAYWSFIGDSRLYHIRGGRVLSRTRDHSVVQRMIDAGEIDEEAVAKHPARNKLLRCLGGGVAPRLEPVARTRLEKDDVLLLCTDGLWGSCAPGELEGRFAAPDPVLTLRELLGRAEANTGPDRDNASAVMVRWQEDARESARERSYATTLRLRWRGEAGAQAAMT